MKRHAERGFALTFVLVTFLLVAVIGLGALSVVMSDLHGAVAHQLAMQSLSVAEAGVNYAVARLAANASAVIQGDDRYVGEADDVALPAPNGRAGTFHVTVRCAYPAGVIPPACRDDPLTQTIDERNVRVITSEGFVPQRPGRARRQIEATVRRYTVGPGDSTIAGVCGRDRVEVGPDTAPVADIGSNGDVVIEGAVRRRIPRTPATAAVITAIAPGSGPGLSGTYTWRVTFVDRRGEQSGGGPATTPVLLNNQYGRLIHLPTGDSTISTRRIYRSLPNVPAGPWFLVGVIPDNSTREYVDNQPDEGLRVRMPGAIEGSVTAGGSVTCSKGCAGRVDGPVRSGARDVVCPNFLPPPVQSGSKPAQTPIIQTAINQTVQAASLRVGENEEFTIQTLSVLNAEVHISVTDLILERGATLAITGLATVYFHVSGTFSLGQDAVFGAIDFNGHLLTPSDRVQVLISARDPVFRGTGIASVRFAPQSKISGLVFAPEANIVVDRAAAMRGGLYGRSVRLSRTPDIFFDPVEGLGSERSGVRPSPYQYLLRWYDNPNPGP